MTARILTGTKQQIADAVVGIPGEVREAIVFVEDSPPAEAKPLAEDDWLAEMEPYAVHIGDADLSRESIYGEPEPE